MATPCARPSYRKAMAFPDVSVKWREVGWACECSYLGISTSCIRFNARIYEPHLFATCVIELSLQPRVPSSPILGLSCLSIIMVNISSCLNSYASSNDENRGDRLQSTEIFIFYWILIFYFVCARYFKFRDKLGQLFFNISWFIIYILISNIKYLDNTV